MLVDLIIAKYSNYQRVFLNNYFRIIPQTQLQLNMKFNKETKCSTPSLKCSVQNLSQNNISMRPVDKFFSITQSLIPIKSPNQSNGFTSQQFNLQQLYQAIGSNAKNVQWRRLQSNHCSRRMKNRPETSKGTRNSGRSNEFSAENYQSSLGNFKAFKMNGLINKENKNISCRNELQSKSKCLQQGKQANQKQDQNKDNQYEDDIQIKIILNRKTDDRKDSSIYGRKFQTELPQDFLTLFAN